MDLIVINEKEKFVEEKNETLVIKILDLKSENTYLARVLDGDWTGQYEFTLKVKPLKSKSKVRYVHFNTCTNPNLEDYEYTHRYYFEDPTENEVLLYNCLTSSEVEELLGI